MPHFYYFILYFTSSKVIHADYQILTILWYKYGAFMTLNTESAKIKRTFFLPKKEL